MSNIPTLKPIQIGPITLAHPTALAPMEGVTDKAFRNLIRNLGGCGLTVTEFISSESLTRQDQKAWKMAELDPDEHPVSIQIYGREPEKMAIAAREAQELGADIVDLNLGCPSKQVTSGCSGSALMKEPDRAQAIFKAVKQAITVPMTVKMRLGWDDDHLNAPDIALMAQDAGASMIVVHGRTRTQMYKGLADWSKVKAVKANIQVPLLVNGDILTAQDAVHALKESSADGVMVGRGSLRDPWILNRISHHLRSEIFEEPSLDQRHQHLLTYFGILRQGVKSDQQALGRIKKVIGMFTRGLALGDELRDKIFHLYEIEAIYDALAYYFDQLKRNQLDHSFAHLNQAIAPSELISAQQEKYIVYQRQYDQNQ
jgi:tRNA-dihydrouridine synthase B